ncbi:carbohydrate ABC transporter permease [Mesoplasma florum]|uniref:carbohydrate ABC transporter permease n=1 Tax=Mesoplasma florum TaxID=2151 RepID=UPI0018F86CEF|nr:sugar ABC transporter permease [Mesoplasma florum]
MNNRNTENKSKTQEWSKSTKTQEWNKENKFGASKATPVTTSEVTQQEKETPKKDKGFILKYGAVFKGNKSKNMEKGKFDFINQLIWVLPGIFFVCIFSYFSIFIIFQYGLSANGANGVFLLSIKNITHLFTEPSREFPIALRNTLIYVLVSVPISLIIALWTAKALSNVLNKKAFAFFQSAFFLPYVTSALAVAMAFSILFASSSDSLLNQLLSKIGLSSVDWREPKNAMIMLIIYGVWRMLPFKIIMFTAALLRVDQRLYQAASIDGVPKWKQFWKISVPQIMPVIIYMITTGIIGSFKFMPFGLFPTYADAVKSDAQTAVYFIFSRVNAAGGGIASYGTGGAAAIVLMAIILTLTLVNRKLSKFLSKKYR